jgi:hypothetical protein
MEIHVLNGDALAQSFHIEGEKVVMRECLMEGPVKAQSFEEFWTLRASFLGEMFDDAEARNQRDLRTELQAFQTKRISGINLWFDHDLFCQVNMWFVVDYLIQNNISAPLYRVMPSPLMTDVWSGFGNMDESDLKKCFEHRIQFQDSDTRLCIDLWHAYRDHDLEALEILATKVSPCFPFLSDAVNAHRERFPKNNGRPERRLKQILNEGKSDFHEIFSEFRKTEGVYGFGDLQVKAMLESLSEQ